MQEDFCKKNMKAKFLTILILCVSGHLVRAQQNKFTMGLGYQRTWMVDKQASPLKYQTSEKTLLFSYNRTGSKGMLSASISGAVGDFFPTGFKNRQMYNPGYNIDGSPKMDSMFMPGTLYSGRVKLGYLRQITNGYNIIGTGKLYSHNYLGASVNNQFFYSDNIVRTGWLNAASLNADYLHTANLNQKHFFSIQISIPLFAQNTRLPYHNSISSPTGEGNFKTFFKQGSRFAWLASFQNIQLNAAYEYGVSKHLNMGIRYFGQWLHYTKEKPVNILQNNIALTVSIK